jgi:glutamate 5-kinase
VAHIVGIRRDFLDTLLVAGQVAVVAPLARDEQGIVCNVNADDAAAGIAAGLGARQLVLMTDVDGVRNAAGEKLAAMTADEAERLIADGVIKGGMVPKIRAALQAVSWPGAEAVIADSSDPHALTRALGDPTFGTRITAAREASAKHRPGRPDRMAAMVINGSSINAKQRRQRALLELVTGSPIGSQEELVELLRVAGYEVTQATVSRDAAELGLVKVPRGDRHVYATPESQRPPATSTTRGCAGSWRTSRSASRGAA